MLSLAGKVAIVTGAGAGLGRAEVMALARAGADVVVNDVVATDALEQLLVAFPVVTGTAPGANPDGTGHLGLVLTFNDPFSCTRGYETTRQRPVSDVTDVPPNEQAYCAEPPGSPIGVRGSQNAPYGGKPVEVPAPKPALPEVLTQPADGPTTLAGLLGLPA